MFRRRRRSPAGWFVGLAFQTTGAILGAGLTLAMLPPAMLLRLLTHALNGRAAGDRGTSSLGDLLHRHRRVLAPLALVPVAAAMVRLVPLLPWWAELSVWAAAAAAAGTWMAAVREKHRPLALLAVILASLWLVAAGTRIVSPVCTALTLLTLAAAATLIRARHFRVRPAAPILPDPILDIWHERLSAPGCPLTGTVVVPAGDLDPDTGRPGWDHYASDGERIGVRLQVRVTRGKHTWRSVKNAAGAIASAYVLEEEQVIVARWPGDAGFAEVILLDAWDTAEEALREVHELTDITFNAETGCWVHAISTDRQEVLCQLYDQQEGAKATWISGLQGGGKSGSADTGLTETTSAGVVWPIIIDCKGGASLADWYDRLGDGLYIAVDPDNAQDVERALRVLRGVIAIGVVRNARLRATPLLDPITGEDVGKAKALRVTPESPCILLVIEEAPQLLRVSPEAGELLQKILELYRAVQISLWLISQAVTALAAFGGNATIKRLIRQGNRIIHRNSRDSGAATGESALPVDPSEIPDIAGAAKIVGPKHKRDITVRVRWTRYPAVWARKAVIPPLEPDAAEAFRRAVEAPITDQAPPVKNPGGSVVQIRPTTAGQQLRDAIAAWICAQPQDVRRADVVAEFRGQGSEDQIDRALARLDAQGAIRDAGHGLWGRPLTASTA
jgi:hypothetical protein